MYKKSTQIVRLYSVEKAYENSFAEIKHTSLSYAVTSCEMFRKHMSKYNCLKAYRL